MVVELCEGTEVGGKFMTTGSPPTVTVVGGGLRLDVRANVKDDCPAGTGMFQKGMTEVTTRTFSG